MGFNTINEIEEADYEKTFLAQVVENNDPDKKQRIKVRIPKLLDGATSDLPWILPLQSAFLGTGVGSNGAFGHLYVPPLQANVVVHFENGELYYGRMSGQTPVSGVSLGVLEVNYPKRYGWIDPAGNHFYVDTTSGSTDIEFKHRSGTTIHISDDGTVLITGVKDVLAQVSRNLNAVVNNTANITVSGDTTINVGGNINSSAAKWNHNGDVSVTGTVTASTDVVGGGISLKSHKHKDVSSGTAISGVPL